MFPIDLSKILQWDQIFLEYCQLFFSIPSCLPRFVRGSPSVGVKDLKRTDTPSQGRKCGSKQEVFKNAWQIESLHPIFPHGSSVSSFLTLASCVPCKTLSFYSLKTQACMASRSGYKGTDPGAGGWLRAHPFRILQQRILQLQIRDLLSPKGVGREDL